MRWRMFYYFLHCLKFTYTKITLPLNNFGHPDDDVTTFEASGELIDNILVHSKHICGCILGHALNTLLCHETSWENQKKSAKISGRQLWPSTSLFHPWVQFPDAWRYHVHPFKHLYASINTMGMSSHHKEETGSMSQRWMCFDAKRTYQWQNRSKTPWEDVGWTW